MINYILVGLGVSILLMYRYYLSALICLAVLIFTLPILVPVIIGIFVIFVWYRLYSRIFNVIK